MKKNVNTVVFDAGFTLIFPDPAYFGACLKIARELDIEIPEDALELAVAKGLEVYREQTSLDPTIWSSNESIRGFFEQLFSFIFDYAFALTGIVLSDGNSTNCGRLVYRNYLGADHWGVFDDVGSALLRLSDAGLRLGVFSDWHTGLDQQLSALGLGARLDFVCTSAELGLGKAQEGSYSRMVGLLGINPSRSVMIGDSYSLDYEPASLLGMQAYLLDRNQTSDYAGLQVVSDLGEAVKKILGLSAKFDGSSPQS